MGAVTASLEDLEQRGQGAMERRLAEGSAVQIMEDFRGFRAWSCDLGTTGGP